MLGKGHSCKAAWQLESNTVVHSNITHLAFGDLNAKKYFDLYNVSLCPSG